MAKPVLREPGMISLAVEDIKAKEMTASQTVRLGVTRPYIFTKYGKLSKPLRLDQVVKRVVKEIAPDLEAQEIADKEAKVKRLSEILIEVLQQLPPLSDQDQIIIRCQSSKDESWQLSLIIRIQIIYPYILSLEQSRRLRALAATSDKEIILDIHLNREEGTSALLLEGLYH